LVTQHAGGQRVVEVGAWGSACPANLRPTQDTGTNALHDSREAEPQELGAPCSGGRERRATATGA